MKPINICVEAFNSQSYFARVLFEQVYLYKKPIDDNSINNIYFEIPKTYFVKLTNLSGEFYEAQYLNFLGYVKKDCVQATSSTPINPYLNNVNFRVYAELSENLWTSPTNKNPNDLITQIPHLSNNLQYIGKIYGDNLIEGRTKVWYFCKYSTTKDYYGYVYSDFCDEMSTISPNTENVTYISNPTFQKETEQINTIPKESNAVGIVVAILSIPALIFIFMILKGTRILSAEKVKPKEIVDY